MVEPLRVPPLLRLHLRRVGQHLEVPHHGFRERRRRLPVALHDRNVLNKQSERD